MVKKFEDSCLKNSSKHVVILIIASIARRDLSAKIAQLEGDLSHKNETVRILESREEALQADKNTLQGKN